jgi:hypothetical protein
VCARGRTAFISAIDSAALSYGQAREEAVLGTEASRGDSVIVSHVQPQSDGPALGSALPSVSHPPPWPSHGRGDAQANALRETAAGTEAKEENSSRSAGISGAGWFAWSREAIVICRTVTLAFPAGHGIGVPRSIHPSCTTVHHRAQWHCQTFRVPPFAEADVANALEWVLAQNS